MIHLFCGYDAREAIGFHVFAHSVIARASEPVALIPLSSLGMAQGSNSFTQSRFLVPKLMGYQGHAIFVDASDMLALGDVAELDALFDPSFAVQVVKHPDYQTAHPRKYRGTNMECANRNYTRKNWASVCIFNCEHARWRGVEHLDALSLLQFGFIPDELIGELPAEWNRLADEGHPVDDAKVLHWTAGVPGFEFYRNAPGADHWHAARQDMERLA